MPAKDEAEAMSLATGQWAPAQVPSGRWSVMRQPEAGDHQREFVRERSGHAVMFADGQVAQCKADELNRR